MIDPTPGLHCAVRGAATPLRRTPRQPAPCLCCSVHVRTCALPWAESRDVACGMCMWRFNKSREDMTESRRLLYLP